MVTILMAAGVMVFGLNKIADPELRHGVGLVVVALIIYVNSRLADARREAWHQESGQRDEEARGGSSPPPRYRHSGR